MPQWIRLAISLALVLPAAGCFTVSADRYLSGPVAVRVLDASDHAPIAQAKVVLSSTENPSVMAVGLTDGDGRVSIPALRGEAHVMIYGDTLMKPATLRVEAAGYQPFATEIKNAGTAEEMGRYYRGPNDTRPPAEILLKKD